MTMEINSTTKYQMAHMFGIYNSAWGIGMLEPGSQQVDLHITIAMEHALTVHGNESSGFKAKADGAAQ